MGLATTTKVMEWWKYTKIRRGGAGALVVESESRTARAAATGDLVNVITHVYIHVKYE